MNGEKMVRFVKTFDHYHHKFNSGHLFSSPVKLQKDLNLKSIPKFNHGFTNLNHDYLHCSFLKALHNFKVERAHNARDNQFLFQNVQNGIFEIFKNVQSSLKLTQKSVIGKAAPSSWYFYVISNVPHYYAVIWKVFNALELHILKSLKVNRYKYSLFFIQAAHFSINNCNIKANGVEKYCFVVLNVKLQVKVRFKTFCWLLELLYTAFVQNANT